MKIINNYRKLFCKKWGKTAILLIVLLSTAFFLRIYNLLILPIFADEAIYVRWSQIMRAESTLRFLPLSDGKQPLFMWVVMFILQFFSNPLTAARTVSVFCGLIALIGLFLLSYRLFKSKKTALITVFLYAISPYTMFFERMALVDSMLNMFGVWSLYLAVLTAQTLRIDTAMLTGFALGGAWLTKSPAVFFLLLLPLTALFSSWPKTGEKKLIHFVKLSSLWLVSYFIAFGMYNILRLGPSFHLIASRNQDYVFSLKEVLRHPLDPFLAHLREISSWFIWLAPVSVLITALCGVVFMIKRKKIKKIILLLGFTFIPLFIQAEFAKSLTARYLLFTLPPLFILAGRALYKAGKKLTPVLFALVVLIVSIPSLAIDYLLITKPAKAPLPRRERSGYLEEWTAGTGIKEIVSYIKKLKKENPQSKIVIGTEGSFGTLPDGLQIYLADLPNVTVIGVGSITIHRVPSQLENAQKAGDRAFLVVNSSRFKGKPEEAGFHMIKFYPKAEKPDGSKESLWLLKVADEKN